MKSDYALALRIAKEKVAYFEIPTKRDFLSNKSNPARWNWCHSSFEDDLFVEYWLIDFANTVVTISLKEVIFRIIYEVRALLSDSKARKLLEVDIQEIEETIAEVASNFSHDYLTYAPTVSYHSSFQTFRELIINYFKKKIEFDIKSAYEDNGEVEKIQTVDFVPNNNLKDLIKRLPHLDLIMFRLIEEVEDEFSAHRKNAFKNRQVWLNKEARTKLPEHYQKLKARYTEAKKRNKSERQAYFQVNRGNSIEQWESRWKEVFSREFPDLVLNRDFASLEPSKLAYAQIAKFSNSGVDYIPKIIREQKKLEAGLNNPKTVIE